MRPGKLPAATHKLMSEPMVGSGLQSPVLVTSAVSLHRPTGGLPTGCVSDQRAQETEHMNADHRKNWWLGILLADGRTSARVWLLFLAYFAISLTFFFIILFNVAILAAEEAPSAPGNETGGGPPLGRLPCLLTGPPAPAPGGNVGRRDGERRDQLPRLGCVAGLGQGSSMLLHCTGESL